MSKQTILKIRKEVGEDGMMKFSVEMPGTVKEVGTAIFLQTQFDVDFKFLIYSIIDKLQQQQKYELNPHTINAQA